MSNYKKIREIRSKLENNMEALREATKEAFPLGTRVSFYKWGAHIEAEVVAIWEGFGLWEPELVVKNLHTKKVYRIDLSYFVKEKKKS